MLRWGLACWPRSGRLAFWFAPWLAKVGLNDADLAPVLRLAAPLLLLGALQDASRGVLAGLEAFRVLARVTAIAGPHWRLA